MKSQDIIEYGQPLGTTDKPTPVPQGTEVVVEIGACGVCHSDVHLHDGYFDMGGGNKLDVRRGRKLPFTLGHEIGGTVVGVGPEAKGAAIGDKRVVYPWIGCGKCGACVRGDEQLCGAPQQLGIQVAGGYATHVLVPHPRYLLDYGNIDPALAATYMCSGLTAFSALKQLGHAGKGDPILILGLGGVGMMGLQFARAMYPDAPIFAADIDTEKLALAAKAGARPIDTREADAAKKIIGATGGGVFGAVDFVGCEPTYAVGNASLRKGGRLVIVGLVGGAMSSPLPLFPMRAISISGSYVGSLADAKDMLSLVQTGKVAPIPLEHRPLSAANASLDDLRHGKVHGRVVLMPMG